jgi:hypothetical protein
MTPTVFEAFEDDGRMAVALERRRERLMRRWLFALPASAGGQAGNGLRD